jgi:hypothetical protein
MAKFRKKPVVIEAIQWNGPSDNAALREFAGHWVNLGDEDNIITTLEGSMRISRGDWIIKGVKGEFYPCKPDIFEATYDPVPSS